MCNSLGVVPLELANDLQIELRAEFGPIVFGSSHLHGRNRKGRKARGKAMTAITAEFDKLMNNEAKSSLLDAVIAKIAGPAEFDKCRLGCAMVDSLKRFEDKLNSDLSEDTWETIPRQGFNLGSDYSRLKGRRPSDCVRGLSGDCGWNNMQGQREADELAADEGKLVQG